MDSDAVTDRLTGEEAPDDVPREAIDRAAEADRRVDQEHLAADDPEAPITES